MKTKPKFLFGLSCTLCTSLMCSVFSNATLALTIDFEDREGQATINCRYLGAGAFAVPWSLETFNSPIVIVNAGVRSASTGQIDRKLFYLNPPGFEYSTTVAYETSSAFDIVQLRGGVLKANGIYSKLGAPLSEVCRVPSN